MSKRGHEQNLQSLLNVQEALLEDLDPARVMDRICSEAIALVPGADGAALQFVGLDGELTYVSAAGSLHDRRRGMRPHPHRNLARLALMAGRAMRSDDTRSDERLDQLAYHEARIGSTLVVPLERGWKTFGVLEVTSRAPGAFTDDDAFMLMHVLGFVTAAISSARDVFDSVEKILTKLPRTISEGEPGILESLSQAVGLTDFVANSMGLRSPEYRHRADARERIRRVLAHGGPSMVVQPIFELKPRKVVGFEALARFNGSPERSPHLWFEEASRVGLALELETATVRAALKTLRELPPDTYLSVNLSPDGATNRSIVELLSDAPAERLVIEVTEHAIVTDYDALNESLKHARDRGTRIAVDDAGAGYASMRHILRLKPECIKLDIGLTRGIDGDPIRRALASSLITFADEIGASIVAEGIESEDEVNALRELGVAYGQGYHLGRPTAPKRAPAISAA
ncbi:MAG: sensor domain-containing phosphodiesterase [Actinomycetota bacterium]